MMLTRFIKGLSELMQAIWLYFPGLLFIILGYVALSVIFQGQDVVVHAAEQPYAGGIMILSVTFWSYVTWHSSRIITDQKFDDPLFLYRHTPRVLGFVCFLIPQLAVINLPDINWGNYAWLLILINAALYALVNYLSHRFPIKINDLLALVLIFVIAFAATLASKFVFEAPLSFLLFTILLYMLQAALFLNFNINRRYALQEMKQQKQEERFALQLKVRMEQQERRFFLLFNLISLIGLLIYVLSVILVPFARAISSYSIVFFAFGILLGVGNLLSFFSMRLNINLHVIVIVLAIVTGSLGRSPYEVQTIQGEPERAFAERQTLLEYTKNWIDKRKPAIEKSDGNYPMIFVLADGGASRSGYWTASCLGMLQDASPHFADHVFMLSGASGGAVGNSVFHSLLNEEDNEIKYLQEAKDFMGNDFLSPTLARMLGPDYFRHVFPLNLPPIKDRAAALEKAMEQPAVGRPLFDKRFSNLITQQDEPSNLPILVVNTTRMNDSHPGIISTVKPDTTFTKRLDVLSLIEQEKIDLQLSTVAIMGARFPYVSPGGDLANNNYFVDGGYFDNSGAGVAHETMQALDAYFSQPAYGLDPELTQKISFYVLHMMNSPVSDTTGFGPVAPILNDLAAPIITLMSSFGQQTNINNHRLYNYLDFGRHVASRQDTFPTRHWADINLYEADTSKSFSMNWVISEAGLAEMDQMLMDNKQMKSVEKWVKSLK